MNMSIQNPSINDYYCENVDQGQGVDTDSGYVQYPAI